MVNALFGGEIILTYSFMEAQQVQDLSLIQSVQTGSGAHPASCPMGTGGDFPEVKRQQRESDHSPPSSAEVKKGRAIPPHLHIPARQLYFVFPETVRFSTLMLVRRLATGRMVGVRLPSGQ
jgi:hypothetical protein